MSFGLVHDVRRQVLVARVGDEGREPRGCVDCHGCRRSPCSTRDCARTRLDCVEGLRRHGAVREWPTLALLRRRANAWVTTALPGHGAGRCGSDPYPGQVFTATDLRCTYCLPAVPGVRWGSKPAPVRADQ